jgi:uncharacterized membrane protein
LPPNDYLKPSAGSRAWAWSRFVLSALGVSLALHLALRQPWAGAVLLFGAVAFGVPQFRARQRLRQLLSSGNLSAILDVWNDAIETLPHHRTVGPLIRATAFAAHGLTDRARGVLERAERGRAWENAIEHRLFVETLLDAFEGRRTQALDKARALRALPLPASPWAKSRASVLRSAAGALARAFAHCPEQGDPARLRAAGKHHPLVHWAMRYALAVVHIDQGRRDEAFALISAAPEWPEGSAFNAFQQELVERTSSRGSRHP